METIYSSLSSEKNIDLSEISNSLEEINNTIIDNNLYSIIQILKNINWKKFNKLCLSIGKELNDPQWRFLKSVFLEKSLEVFSDKLLCYVGNEEKGCDFIVSSLDNIKIEMKYTEGALFGGKNMILRNNTKQITLLNSKGTNKHKNLPDSYADYLLIVETYGAGIISKETLKKYVISNGDSLTTIIPTSEITIIFSPIDIETNKINTTQTTNLEIKNTFMNIIENIISSV